jgi:broad specificity phosphatase PhoE
MPTRLVLVKHAQPVLDAAVPARLWTLGEVGEVQATRLAWKLRELMPLTLVCSREPKAKRTCEIVASELGVSMRVVDGLEELDRPVLPLMSAEEHDRLNSRIFEDLAKPGIGEESGLQALGRFTTALTKAIDEAATDTLVVVTHGTVVSLLVSKHNDVDPIALWRRLSCPSFAVLTLPTFELRAIVDHLG